MADSANSQDVRIKRLENGLKWVSQLAGMHYATGAFDPEHMRIIANMCYDILNENDFLPDFEETIKEGTKQAQELAQRIQDLAE